MSLRIAFVLSSLCLALSACGDGHSKKNTPAPQKAAVRTPSKPQPENAQTAVMKKYSVDQTQLKAGGDASVKYIRTIFVKTFQKVSNAGSVFSQDEYIPTEDSLNLLKALENHLDIKDSLAKAMRGSMLDLSNAVLTRSAHVPTDTARKTSAAEHEFFVKSAVLIASIPKNDQSDYQDETSGSSVHKNTPLLIIFWSTNNPRVMTAALSAMQKIGTDGKREIKYNLSELEYQKFSRPVSGEAKTSYETFVETRIEVLQSLQAAF